MAFERPTLAQLADRIEQDLVSRLTLSTPILRRAVVRVLARVVAGAAHLLHGHLEFLSRQIFPTQQEREYLLRFGSLFGLTLNAAEYSTGNITVTGTDATVIPAGSILRRADATEYATDAEATISSGTAIVAVTAVVAGLDGDCNAATELSFESPISGADATATVATGGLAGGADEETTEEFRVRVLERMASPPHGGNASDYVAWAKEVSGVTRAWCTPIDDGPGTVTVRFVRDNDGTGAAILPSAGEVTAVSEHILGTSGASYLDRLAPAAADVTVEAPAALNVTVVCSVVPDTSVVRDAVEESLADLFSTARPGGVMPLSQFQVAIGTATGVESFTLTSPVANVVPDPDEIPILHAVTWPT